VATAVVLAAIATVHAATNSVAETSQSNSVADPMLQPSPPQPFVPPAPEFRPSRPALRSPASFTYDMPLEEAIEILRYSTQPPLNIVVLWGDLDNNAGIDRLTPIGIDGVSGIRLRQCIELLVTSLSASSGVKIGYVVHGGAVTIGTIEYLPQAPRQNRVYDISDLVAPPSPAMGMGMGMMPGMMGMGMGMGMGMMPGMGMMGMGMMSGLGGLGGFNSGYGNYNSRPGYNNSLGGLPGFISGTQTGLAR
jgi:hypothetical protein